MQNSLLWSKVRSYSTFLVTGLIITELVGRYPGNIDLLWSNFFRKDLYLGDGFARAIDTYGTIFANNVLGDYRIITIEPHHVKQILALDFNHYEKGPNFRKYVIFISVLIGLSSFMV